MRRGTAIGVRSESAQHDVNHLIGQAMVVTSQVALGSMGLLYKVALAGGASSLTILAVRFPLASLAIWGLVLVTGRQAALPRRRMLGLQLLGGGCYVLQSFTFLAALSTGCGTPSGCFPLSTATLLQVIHPAVVTVFALMLGRERATPMRLVALGCSLAGGVLIIGSPGQGGNALGLALSVASPLVYASYILLGERLLRGVDPLVAAAYVTASAGAVFAAAALLFGDFSFALSRAAWLSILVIVVFCTVFAVTAFLAGLPRIGPSAGSIAGMLEFGTGVMLAVAVLGERLTPGTIAGGALVLLAVVLLRKPVPRPAIAGAGSTVPTSPASG
jgi:drug/metabolite transporter (DMT)-like permease